MPKFFAPKKYFSWNLTLKMAILSWNLHQDDYNSIWLPTKMRFLNLVSLSCINPFRLADLCTRDSIREYFSDLTLFHYDINPIQADVWGGIWDPPPLHSLIVIQIHKIWYTFGKPILYNFPECQGGSQGPLPPPAGIELITKIELKWSLVDPIAFISLISFSFVLIFFNIFFKNHLYSLNPCSLNQKKFTNQRPLHLYQNL